MAENMMKTKPLYERENLIITEFDTEDVITTSGITPNPQPVALKKSWKMLTAHLTALTKLPVLGSDTFEKDVTALQRQIDELKIYQQKKQTTTQS